MTRDLYHDHHYQAFVYAPVGFVSEHLEVLYDNDFECKAVTNELGTSYYRPAMPNSQPEFIDALSTVIFKALEK